MQPADANGIALPAGFRNRVVTRSGAAVGSTGYVWHGGAVFPTSTGGWLYVSNSELASGKGGASAIRFSRKGAIEKAYRILSGTNLNCSGGATPWDRWLSGEEVELGQVYECDPRGTAAAAARPAMGRKHEAAAVDAVRGAIYLTEDQPDSCFYRFHPKSWPSLTARRARGGLRRSDERRRGVEGGAGPLRSDHPYPLPGPGRAALNGREGCFYERDVCWFTTKGDNKVWAYNAVTGTLTTAYEDNAVTSGTAILRGVDALTVSRARDVFVGEDGDDMQIHMIRGDVVSTVLQVTGQSMSEITGIAFNPAGDRMYFSSQRGTAGTGGITYEVTGPF